MKILSISWHIDGRQLLGSQLLVEKKTSQTFKISSVLQLPLTHLPVSMCHLDKTAIYDCSYTYSILKIYAKYYNTKLLKGDFGRTLNLSILLYVVISSNSLVQYRLMYNAYWHHWHQLFINNIMQDTVTLVSQLLRGPSIYHVMFF